MSRCLSIPIFLCLGALALAPLLGRAEARCRAFRVVKPPTIDGKLDDATWNALPMHTGFIYHNQGDTYAADEYQSEFRVGWDDEHLYVAIRGTEPRIEAHLENARKKETGEANWKYQLYEIFLDPGGWESGHYYHFAFDLLGHQRATKANLGDEPFHSKETKWDKIDFPWRGAVHYGSDFWSLELVFDLDGFAMQPKAGDEWGFHVGRHGTWARPGLHWKIANWTAWAPMPSIRWREVREHGTLEFMPDALLPDYQNVGRKTEAINRDYFAWKATQGAAMQRINDLLARIEGKADVMRGTDDASRAKCYVFGHGPTRPPPEEPNLQWNRNWHTPANGNPKTIVCTWDQPVTFNFHRVEWISTVCYASQYSLEYWADDAWNLVYAESNNKLPTSVHAFPEVTTEKVRFTIAKPESENYYLALTRFQLYRIDQEAE